MSTLLSALLPEQSVPVDPAIARQLALEEWCISEGQQLQAMRITKHEQKGRVSMTPYGKALMKMAVAPLAEALETFLERSNTGVGRRAGAAIALAHIESTLASYLTVKVAVNAVMVNDKLTSVARAVGTRILDEIRFAQFEEKAPALFAKTTELLDQGGAAYDWKKRRVSMNHAMKTFNLQIDRAAIRDQVQVGMAMLDLLIETTGWFTVEREVKIGKRAWMLVPTPELLEFIDKYKEKSSLFAGLELPMICPPASWTTPTDGGYLTPRLRSRLLRCQRPGYFETVKMTKMPEVYEAVNAVQSVPYRINLGPLDTADHLWTIGQPVAGLPQKFSLEVPPKPPKGSPEYKPWKTLAGNIFRKNRTLNSQRLQVSKILEIGRMYDEEERFYFPLQLDFRGRMYAKPTFLNPQGSDLAKSLLTFSDGKPLGKRGAHWLAVHAANTFGYDKASMEEREEWTHQNSDDIRRSAEDPVGHQWWSEADSPFQFLAACFEWAGYLKRGEGYECSLPIVVDGSNNGLQHLAAITRDEEAGKLVNLVPADKPADVYGKVAEITAERVTADIINPDAHIRMYARGWTELGIKRDVAKRPVMVLCYGGTSSSRRDYIKQWLYEKVEDPKTVFGENVPRAVTYLSNVMGQVMDEVIVGPRSVMKWCRSLAAKYNEMDLPINWTVPTGFPVQQSYPDMEPFVVRSRLGERFIDLQLHAHLPTLLKRRQSSALAPNLIHSLDAAALMRTINACWDKGIRHFVAIHDCYGTLAADMDILAETLRDEFVKMYEGFDVFDELLSKLPDEALIDVPELPEIGNLDLNGIRKQKFFFA